MFDHLQLQISHKLSAKPCLTSLQMSYVKENSFWSCLKDLKQIGLCHPLITLVRPKGVFARFKLLRPFLEFEIFIESTNPKILNEKLMLSFTKTFPSSQTQAFHQRPIFKKMQELSPDMVIDWSSKISPLEGHHIQWALSRIYEKSWKLKLSKKALLIRTFIGELQRVLWILNYLKNLSVALSWIEWKDLWLNYRECFFQIQETISGHRIFPNIIMIGGVKTDIKRGHQKRIKTYIIELSCIISKDVHHFLQKAHSLKGFLPLDRDDLEKATWGGIVAKATHSYWDARLFAPYSFAEYSPVCVKSRRLPVGDGFDRLKSASSEILHAFKNLGQIISNLSMVADEPFIIANIDKKQKMLKASGTSVVEGASGPIYACLRDEQMAISTSSMRVCHQLPYFLFDIDDDHNMQLALASLGYQECEGSLA